MPKSVLLFVIAACASLSGCADVPSEQPGGAAITVNGVSGTASTLLSANMDKSYAACQEAISSMQFKPIAQSKDVLRAVLTAKTADERDISISLERVSDSITQLDVNCGGFRTELAQTIARKIQSLTK